MADGAPSEQQRQTKKRRFFDKDSAAGGGSSGKRARSDQPLEPGMKGFFVSATKGRERAASKEVTDLLLEKIGELYPGVLDAESSEEADSAPKAAPAAGGGGIEAEIAAELASLASAAKDAMLNHHSAHLLHLAFPVDCLFFLQLAPGTKAEAQVDPVRVVTSLVADAARTAQVHAAERGISAGARTKYAHRIVPFASVVKCGAGAGAVAELAREVVRQFTCVVGEGAEKEPTTFALALKLRTGTAHDRDALIAELAAPLVAMGHKVDLTRAEVTVVVEFFRNMCGVAVVGGGLYSRLRKLNLYEAYSRGEDVPAAETEQADE